MKNTLCISALILTSIVGTPVYADDNIAACEIVLMTSVLSPELEIKVETETLSEPRPMIATFLPADKFIFSVFDNKPGYLSEVGGEPIRALMCTRINVLPTEFDTKFIRTNIPLHLSQNFDSPDSALLSIRKKDGKYGYEYAGPDLSVEDNASLKSYLKRLNTQDED